MPERDAFVILFDSRFLFGGIALARSLLAHAPGHALYVVCLDEATFRILSALSLPHARLVLQKDFETPALLAVKPARNASEYAWTCKSAAVRHVLALDASLETVTYLDSDLFFFAPPEPVFAELAGGSLLLTEHRFPERNREAMLRRNGRFNAQWIS
ncbi:MAG: hypothetical protein V1918_00005, partial [Planctomycetota bacterium]